jgi:hypothetical protein
MGTTAPAGAWVCPEARTLECGDELDTLYVNEGTPLSCASGSVSVSNAGPFGVGTHEIAVRDAEGSDVCTAALTVVDTEAPVLTAQTVQLWPPNHKLHTLSVSDCVQAEDRCEGELHGEFIWASSDEPQNDIGDGNHEPDILFSDCQTVQLRAERQGPREGRVYTLGVRVTDASGHSVDSQCQVIVDHDQRGQRGSDSGEAYRIELNGQRGTLECGGPVENEDAGTPGSDEDASVPDVIAE